MMARVSRVVPVVALLLGAPAVHPALAQTPPPDEIARRQYESGLEFMRTGRFAEAVKDFQTVVDGYPSSPVADDALVAIARYQLEVARNPAAAMAAVDTLLKRYAASDSVPMAYVLAGQATGMQATTPAQLESALANYERVPRLFPGSEAVAPALYYAGDIERRINRVSDALAHLRRVSMEFPGTPWAARAQVAEGHVLATTGQPIEAMLVLQRVVASAPTSAEAITAKAWNTTLYRLFLRAPQPPYSASPRSIAGPSGKLRDVVGLAAGADGTVFVGTKAGVTMYDPKGSVGRSIGAPEARGVAVDRQARVVALQRDLVNREGPQGMQRLPLSVAAQAGGTLLKDMEAVAVLSSGDLAVSDKEMKNVYRFDQAGKPVRILAQVRAMKLAAGLADELAILDRDSKSVLWIDRDAKAIARIAPKGAGYDLQPRDVAFDSLGHLYVLDRAAVAVFNRAGRLMTLVTPPASAAFRDASALAVDGAGRLFVYDEQTERVLVLQ